MAWGDQGWRRGAQSAGDAGMQARDAGLLRDGRCGRAPPVYSVCRPLGACESVGGGLGACGRRTPAFHIDSSHTQEVCRQL